MQGYLGPVPGHIADDLDRTVRQDMQRSVRIAEYCPAHGDFFHRTGDTRSFDCVSNFKLIFRQDKESVNYVLDQGLRAEANGKSGNAGAGEQGSDVEAEGVQHLHKGNKNNDEHARAVNDSSNRFYLLRPHRSAATAVPFRQSNYLPRDDPQQPDEDKRQHQNEHDLGRFIADPLNQVVVPLLPDAAEVFFHVVDRIIAEPSVYNRCRYLRRAQAKCCFRKQRRRRGRLSRQRKILIAILFIMFIAALLPAIAWQRDPRSMTEQDKEMQERQLKAANKKRQEDIRNDTDKLFQLATELKAAVDKSNENVLSLDVVRKADEVEKLAKRVKEKMKQAVGPSPRTEPVPPMPYPRPPR